MENQFLSLPPEHNKKMKKVVHVCVLVIQNNFEKVSAEKRRLNNNNYVKKQENKSMFRFGRKEF